MMKRVAIFALLDLTRKLSNKEVQGSYRDVKLLNNPLWKQDIYIKF